MKKNFKVYILLFGVFTLLALTQYTVAKANKEEKMIGTITLKVDEYPNSSSMSTIFCIKRLR